MVSAQSQQKNEKALDIELENEKRVANQVQQQISQHCPKEDRKSNIEGKSSEMQSNPRDNQNKLKVNLNVNQIVEESKRGNGLLIPAGKRDDDDASSSNASQKSVQSSYSDMSNNSRAHMFKVE